MNKKIIMIVAACATMTAFAHNGWNHWLAGSIVDSVASVVAGPRVVVAPAPAPVVATTPVVTTAPVVTTVPAYSYGYYNSVYCPTYQGYYYYGNSWVWGGRPWYGHRPPPPMWRPHHHGPGPGFHHGPHHGGHHHHHR